MRKVMEQYLCVLSEGEDTYVTLWRQKSIVEQLYWDRVSNLNVDIVPYMIEVDEESNVHLRRLDLKVSYQGSSKPWIVEAVDHETGETIFSDYIPED